MLLDSPNFSARKMAVILTLLVIIIQLTCLIPIDASRGGSRISREDVLEKFRLLQEKKSTVQNFFRSPTSSQTLEHTNLKHSFPSDIPTSLRPTPRSAKNTTHPNTIPKNPNLKQRLQSQLNSPIPSSLQAPSPSSQHNLSSITPHQSATFSTTQSGVETYSFTYNAISYDSLVAGTPTSMQQTFPTGSTVLDAFQYLVDGVPSSAPSISVMFQVLKSVSQQWQLEYYVELDCSGAEPAVYVYPQTTLAQLNPTGWAPDTCEAFFDHAAPFDVDATTCYYDASQQHYFAIWTWTKALYHRQDMVLLRTAYNYATNGVGSTSWSFLPYAMFDPASSLVFYKNQDIAGLNPVNSLYSSASTNPADQYQTLRTGQTIVAGMYPTDMYGNYVLADSYNSGFGWANSLFGVELPAGTVAADSSKYNPSGISGDETNGFVLPIATSSSSAGPTGCEATPRAFLMASGYSVANVGLHKSYFVFQNQVNPDPFILNLTLLADEFVVGETVTATKVEADQVLSPTVTVKVPTHTLTFIPKDQWGNVVSFSADSTQVSLKAADVTVTSSDPTNTAVACPAITCSGGVCCVDQLCTFTIVEQAPQAAQSVQCTYTFGSIIERVPPDQQIALAFTLTPVISPISTYEYRCIAQDDPNQSLISCNDAGLNAVFCNTGSANCPISITSRVCYDTAYSQQADNIARCSSATAQYDAGDITVSTIQTTCQGTLFDLNCGTFAYLCQTNGKWVQCTDSSITGQYCNTGSQKKCDIQITDRKCFDTSTNTPAVNESSCETVPTIGIGTYTPVNALNTQCTSEKVDLYCGYQTPVFEYRCALASHPTVTITCNDAGLSSVLCNTGPNNNCQVEIKERFCFDTVNNVKPTDQAKCSASPTTQFTQVGLVTPTTLTNDCSTPVSFSMFSVQEDPVSSKLDIECGSTFDYRCSIDQSTTIFPCTDAGVTGAFCNSPKGTCSGLKVTKKECYNVTNQSSPVAASVAKCQNVAATKYNLNDLIPSSVIPTTCGSGMFDLMCSKDTVSDPKFSKLDGFQEQIVAGATNPFILELYTKDNVPLKESTTSRVIFTITALKTRDGANVDCNVNEQKLLYCFSGVAQPNTPNIWINFSSQLATITWRIGCTIDGVACENVNNLQFQTIPTSPINSGLQMHQYNPNLSETEYSQLIKTGPIFLDSIRNNKAEMNDFLNEIQARTALKSQYFLLETQYTHYITMKDTYGNRIMMEPTDPNMFLAVVIQTKDFAFDYVQCISSIADPSTSSPKHIDENGIPGATTQTLLTGSCIYDSATSSYKFVYSLKEANPLTYGLLFDDDTSPWFAFLVSLPGDPDQTNSQVLIETNTNSYDPGNPTPIPAGTTISYSSVLIDKYGNIIFEVPVGDQKDSKWPTDQFEINFSRGTHQNFGLDSITLEGPAYSTQQNSDNGITFGIVSFHWAVYGALPFSVSFLYNQSTFYSIDLTTTPLTPSLSSTPTLDETVVRSTDDSTGTVVTNYSYKQIYKFTTYDRYGNVSPVTGLIPSAQIVSSVVSGTAICPTPVCDQINGCCDATTSECSFSLSFTQPSDTTVCNYKPFQFNQYSGFLQNSSPKEVVIVVEMKAEAPSIYQYRCSVSIPTEKGTIQPDRTAIESELVVCSTEAFAATFCSTLETTCQLDVDLHCFDITTGSLVDDNTLCEGGNADVPFNTDENNNTLLSKTSSSEFVSATVNKCVEETPTPAPTPRQPAAMKQQQVVNQIKKIQQQQMSKRSNTFESMEDSTTTQLDLMCGYVFKEPEEPNDLVDEENSTFSINNFQFVAFFALPTIISLLF